MNLLSSPMIGAWVFPYVLEAGCDLHAFPQRAVGGAHADCTRSRISYSTQHLMGVDRYEITPHIRLAASSPYFSSHE